MAVVAHEVLVASVAVARRPVGLDGQVEAVRAVDSGIAGELTRERIVVGIGKTPIVESVAKVERSEDAHDEDCHGRERDDGEEEVEGSEERGDQEPHLGKLSERLEGPENADHTECRDVADGQGERVVLDRALGDDGDASLDDDDKVEQVPGDVEVLKAVRPKLDEKLEEKDQVEDEVRQAKKVARTVSATDSPGREGHDYAIESNCHQNEGVERSTVGEPTQPRLLLPPPEHPTSGATTVPAVCLPRRLLR